MPANVLLADERLVIDTLTGCALLGNRIQIQLLVALSIPTGGSGQEVEIEGVSTIRTVMHKHSPGVMPD